MRVKSGIEKNKKDVSLFYSLKSTIGRFFYDLKVSIFKPKKTKRPIKAARRTVDKYIFLFVMLCLPVANFCLFWIYLNFNSILLGFQTFTGEWTLNNFNFVFDAITSSGGELAIALGNTAKYFFINIFILFPGGIIISYFLYKKILGYRLLRVIFFLPSIISGVVYVAVFKEFIKPWGPIGVMAEVFGHPIPPAGLLGMDATATGTIIAYVIWTGFSSNIMLFSGAMSRVPIDLFEAAKLDGCGPFRELVNIIIPLIWPIISTMFILQLTGFFSADGPILLFTNGTFKTATLGFWIFQQATGSEFYGNVSAAGFLFTMIGVPIVLLLRWLVEKIPAVEY